MEFLQAMEFMRFHPASLSFLFGMLPLMLLAYYLAPRRFRPGVLLGESLLYYYVVEPDGLLALIVCTAISYMGLHMMEQYDKFPRYRKWCFFTCLSVSLGLLVWFGISSRMIGRPLMLGVQIYALSAISVLWDVYRREIPARQNPVLFALYICFFPRLHAGPMQSYQGFAAELEDVSMKPGAILDGWGQYIQGVFKTAVLGGQLYALYRSAVAMESVTVLSAWLQVFAFAFAFYFTLSGFCNIARGIGVMFGIVLPKNYYYPYQSRNISDLFDRFNVTLNRFFRDTLYAALRGNSASRMVDAMSIFVTAMAMGLWFGLRLSYLLWGAYLALFVVLERYVYPKLLEHIPRLFCRIGTLLVVLSSFTIFCTDSLSETGALVRSMFRFEAFSDEQVLYLLTSNWLLILCSFFFATNAVNLGVTKLRRAAPVISGIFLGVCELGILGVYIALSL